MWIAFRLVLALFGFAIRVARRRTKFNPTGERDGVRYRVKVRRRRWGIVGFSLRMPRRSPTWLRMHSEGALDRWAKRLRFSREFQTGDARFDELVYVTSDHPYAVQALATSAALREAISELFEAGYRRVEFDGTSVVIDRKSSVAPTEGNLELLSNVHRASALLERDVPSRFADAFLWKALVFEGFIWSLFGYAVGALFQLFTREPLFVAPGEVVRLGLSVAAASFVALLSLIAFVMRGSSRGHRIVIESAVILLLGMPAASIQLVADTNRALDTAEPKRRSVALRGCEVREHRNKKSGRLSYTYHLMLAREPHVTGDRDSFNVTQGLCSAAGTTDHAEIVIGPGRWSLPWYREITVGNKTWSATL